MADDPDLSVDSGAAVFPSKQVPEMGVEGCNSTRRHGRFLVQQVEEGTKVRSPVCKPRASPGTRSVLSERRPSRIIGRFEVSELFPSSVDTTAAASGASSPAPKSTTNI